MVLAAHFNPLMFAQNRWNSSPWGKVVRPRALGGILLVTAYAMGTLYDHKEARLRELRETYNGILIILRQFISKDPYTQNHSYRVSVYAASIAARLGV